MKRISKLTLCSMMAALAAVFMLIAYFPYLTYAIPAFSGLFIMAVVIEIDKRWAFLTFLASIVPIFLLAEVESKLLYMLFFGYYPIIKALIEKIKSVILEWVLKLGIFNVAVVSIYFIFSGILDISFDDFGILGKYGAIILLVLGNAVFVVYDVAVSRMAMVYVYVFQPKIKKLLL